MTAHLKNSTMIELRFKQNMFNPRTRIITANVNYAAFKELLILDWGSTIAMRSDHTNAIQMFHWKGKGEINKIHYIYYYNEELDVYLCVIQSL